MLTLRGALAAVCLGPDHGEGVVLVRPPFSSRRRGDGEFLSAIPARSLRGTKDPQPFFYPSWSLAVDAAAVGFLRPSPVLASIGRRHHTSGRLFFLRPCVAAGFLPGKSVGAFGRPSFVSFCLNGVLFPVCPSSNRRVSVFSPPLHLSCSVFLLTFGPR